MLTYKLRVAAVGIAVLVSIALFTEIALIHDLPTHAAHRHAAAVSSAT